MRHHRLSICAAVALTAVATALGPAASQEPEILVETVPLGVVSDGRIDLRDVESMIGIPVYNALDEEIAQIETLLVSGDRIAYARLGLGGFLFFGGEQLVVPFSVLSFRQSQEAGRETTLEAVIETVRTPDQLRALIDRGPIVPPGKAGE